MFYYVNRLQINFDSDFYEEIFDDSYAVNDFIEMSYKMNLECDSISLLSYIKVKYEILDENNSSLFIKSVNLNEYKYFSKYVFIDEYILYNFINNITKIKFVITFKQMLIKSLKCII